MLEIYDWANNAVDVADDFCDNQPAGFGPTNCELAQFGLTVTGHLSTSAGGFLGTVGTMVGATGVGAPIGAALIGAGGFLGSAGAAAHAGAKGV